MERPLDIRLFVPGHPVPKGSHQAWVVPRGSCKECRPGKHCGRKNCIGGRVYGAAVGDQQGAELSAWERMVNVMAISARNTARQRLVRRPNAIECVMVFVLARPAGHWAGSGQLTAEARKVSLPSVKPDLDKLARAAGDGLTGALVEDDAQTCVSRLAKVYAPWRGKTGLVLRARQISSVDAWVDNELQYAGLATQASQGELVI